MIKITEDFNIRLNKALEKADMKPVDLAKKTGLAESTISQYRSGYAKPKRDRLALIANVLGVSPVWLMGIDIPEDVLPIGVQRLPILGEVACGEPKFMDEELECYVDVTTNLRADFVLKAKGDSMIGARIFDGDIVFVRKQDIVENGEIAVVAIDDEATLKRFYKYDNLIILRAENPNYKDIEIKESDGKSIRILGKAIAFQSDVR